MWCSVEGLGERVLVELIDGKDRDALLKTQGLEKAAALEPLKFVTLACNRRLTPASKMQLVYGKGVSTPSGVPNSVENATTLRFVSRFQQASTASAETPSRPAC